MIVQRQRSVDLLLCAKCLLDCSGMAGVFFVRLPHGTTGAIRPSGLLSRTLNHSCTDNLVPEEMTALDTFVGLTAIRCQRDGCGVAAARVANDAFAPL